MGVNVLGLFGPEDSVIKASPIYLKSQKIIGIKCLCINSLGKNHFCSQNNTCIESIKPRYVYERMLISLST
jgi:hypothetical protein